MTLKNVLALKPINDVVSTCWNNNFG